jgi:hypothetical protein
MVVSHETLRYGWVIPFIALSKVWLKNEATSYSPSLFELRGCHQSSLRQPDLVHISEDHPEVLISSPVLDIRVWLPLLLLLSQRGSEEEVLDSVSKGLLGSLCVAQNVSNSFYCFSNLLEVLLEFDSELVNQLEAMDKVSKVFWYF